MTYLWSRFWIWIKMAPFLYLLWRGRAVTALIKKTSEYWWFCGLGCKRPGSNSCLHHSLPGWLWARLLVCAPVNWVCAAASSGHASFVHHVYLDCHFPVLEFALPPAWSILISSRDISSLSDMIQQYPENESIRGREMTVSLSSVW